MAVANPLIVLSYVGGPAVLTSATSLLVLSTSNRFARAVDRSRLLSERLSGPAAECRPSFWQEMPELHRRVLLIGRALVSFYLAVACFALATLGSIAGALLGQVLSSPLESIFTIAAFATGLVGFCAFITGAAMLVGESRTAIRSLSRECDEAIALAAQKNV